MMHLSSLYLYPIKSCAPLVADAAAIESRGLEHDRRWMVVDGDGRFLTGRELPRMTLIQVRPHPQGLSLDAPGMPTLQVPLSSDCIPIPVTVWTSEIAARPMSAEADAWLSEFLQHDVRLVHMDDSVVRMITSPQAEPGDEVSFADAFPVLLISRAALTDLNARLQRPVSMLRFRPNLVVDGVPAHAEDDWKRIRIGDVAFDVVKACVRCVFTTVDPMRGERDRDGEPLRTLIGYRRTPDGVTFGQLLTPRSLGILRVGDEVSVLA